VTYGVLPALLVVSVVRKVGHDKLVDTVQRSSPVREAHDGHSYEGNVTVGGFDHRLYDIWEVTVTAEVRGMVGCGG